MRLNASLTLTEEQGIFLSEEVKKQLRDYRKQYNISTKEQCDLLTEFGWTFDDYEVSFYFLLMLIVSSLLPVDWQKIITNERNYCSYP
jgi:hypothetical protein